MIFDVGDTIGSYEIVGTIGQGGMATVYKAHHARLDRFVAVKVMHPTFLQDQSFIARFEREARIVAKLEHPNIVPIYDFSDYNGSPYLVMKYIEGRTLKQRILKQGISLAEALKMMRAIADALDFAHQHDVLHRDIKPSNILVDDSDTAYLTDFGLARIAQAGESTISHDMMLGTPFYISPEQAKGERNLDQHTDIYSLGVIFYELLVGHVPFTADTPYAIVHAHIYKQPVSPSDINPELPPEVNAVMEKALAKNPQDRYHTANEMMDALEAALAISEMKDLPPLQEMPIAPPARPAISAAEPRREGERYATDSKGRKVRVEREIDMGSIGWEDWGERLGERIERGVESLLGDNTRNLTEEERIRRRVEKRLKKQRELVTHVGIYIAINLMLWMIFIFSSIEDVAAGMPPGEALFPWPLIVSLAWGAGVFANWMEYRGKYGAGAEKREEMIQREIERELGYSAAVKQKNKAKNDMALDDLMEDDLESQRVRLNDEGEFSDSFAEERGWKRRHERRRRS